MSNRGLFFCCVFLATFFHMLTSSVYASDYYILPFDGNSLNGDGSLSVRPSEADASGAWNGLENINWNKINAGDRILLQKGSEYYGQIEILKSGEQGKNITFSTFGDGSNPIVTGGKQLSQVSGDWDFDSSQNCWSCAKFKDGSWSNGIFNAATSDGQPLHRSYSPEFKYYYGEFSNKRFNPSVFLDNEPWKHVVIVSVLPFNVLINGKSYIKFEGLSFTLANGWSAPQYAGVHIEGGSHHIYFTDCKISYSSYSGMWVVGSDYISLSNCEVFGNYCTAFYFRAGASYATISGCKIYQNGKYLSVNNHTDTGALLMGSTGVGVGHTIENNEIYDNGKQSVVDRVDGKFPDGTLVWLNHSGKIWKKDLTSLKRWGGVASYQGVYFLGVENKNLEKADDQNSCDAAKRWFWDHSSQTLFFYSESDPNTGSEKVEIGWKFGPDPAISLWGIKDTVVKGNYVHDNFCSGIGVTYTTSENIVIENNRIENNVKNSSCLHYLDKFGVLVSGRGGFVLRGNTILNNGGSEMVKNPLWGGLVMSTSSISPSKNSVIENNTIAGNGGYQLSFYRYLTGTVLQGTKSDYNKITGDGMTFYYLTSSYNFDDYKSVSTYDLHSEYTGLVSSVNSPVNLRLK